MQLSREGSWSLADITLSEISYLRVALKCGRHLVHGSVKDMQEPVGSSNIPLYDFYLLFASVEFKF